MKRKICAIFMALFILANAMTIYSLAKEGESLYEQRLRLNGFTEQDELELKAIMYLSDENVSALIVNKYKELGDWKKVRAYYKVDEKKYESYMLGEKLWQETLNKVPDYIFEEMQQKGWTEKDRNQFVSRLEINRIGYEYGWA